ncbi:hypothetical protein Q8F55_005738 [Vanrija albida]|uniref:Ig-like domain-containing protein n=1 Tax=Vanrija albida TaxID=181172 RepID=A0ABR3Q2F1_9TREE
MSSSFLPFATGLFSRKRKNPSRGVTAPAPAAGPSSVLPSTLDAPRAQASRDSSQTSTNTTHSTSTASTKSFLPFGNPEAHYKPRKAPSLDAGLHSHHHRGAPRKRESAALQQQRPLSPSASVPPTFLHVPASPFQQASPAVSIASTRSYPTQSSGWSDTQDLFQWERQAALGRAPSRRDASRSSSESGPATGSLPSAHEVILVPLPSPAPRYPSSTKLSSSYDEDSDEAPLDALEVLEIFYEDAVPLPAWMEQALMEPLASPPPSPWPGARGPLPALPPPTPSTPTTPTTPRVSGRTRGGSISAVRSPTPSTIRASIIPPSPRQSTTNPTNRFSLRPKGVTFEDSSSAHGHTRHQSVQLQERPTDV